MGMRLDDFCRLSPQEYSAAAEAYGNHEDAVARGSWERMRQLARIAISPHVKRTPAPDKLFPLPWDKPRKPTPKGKPIDKQAAMKRFAEVARKVEGKG